MQWRRRKPIYYVGLIGCKPQRKRPIMVALGKKEIKCMGGGMKEIDWR